MKRLVVGISGASGAILGIRLLQVLRDTIETHLIISPTAAQVITAETTYTVDDVVGMATRGYAASDLSAPIASGSYRCDGMVVVPCSIRSLADVANGHTASLLTRAADVTLKQARRLVLAVRETPLHWGHLDLMARAAHMGALICPPIPAFYSHPRSVKDIIDGTVGRILDVLAIENELYPRWGESPGE